MFSVTESSSELCITFEVQTTTMENLKNNHLVDFVFFSDNDILKKGTSEYNDFWLFWDKYERFRKSKKQPEPSSLKDGNKFDFPTKFDKRYKINFAISTTTIKERYKEYTNRYSDKRACGITMDQLSELKQILLYYYDFLQKQKFSKLLKLKEDQKNLPIYQYKDQIIYTLRSNQVVVIAGDTGCGKSTQVPQYLLNGGFTNIACTQPRKIACVSLAKRVGYETLNEYKSEIGYQVRFETNKTKLTKVLFLTEGVLLRQFQSDPELSMYNVIVVDEVHERHINGDFLLGVLKCLLQQRSDLRLILMSATINIELFVNYFSNSPVVQVPGRLFPIELQYLPHFLDKSEKSGVNERLNPSPYLRIMQLIDKKYPSNERGDLLIFMSGMAEISAVVEAAKEYAFKTNGWIILPLHSALSIEEQDKVFDIPPEGVRKCIVSTNIAETSVTIDGVRFVADSGKVKEMRYDTQVKMQRLQEFWISQASAEQRKGRAGRTGPGVCFRLYSDANYESFSPYSTSEIHRVPLESLVLQMTSLGLRDATLFPFIEPPAKNSLINSTYLLKQQGAITSDGELTPIGRMLARLPVDITLGKMLIMGSLFSLVEPVLVISAALSVQSPLTKCFGQSGDHESESRRKELLSKHGDAFSLLNIYDEWILVKSDRKSNSRKWCKRRGIEEQRLYEISKLKRQFENLLKDYGLLNNTNKTIFSSDHSRSRNQPSRKELLSLKRQHHTSNSRKRKMLKLHRIGEEGVDDGDSENEDEGTHIDIHDIDFKLNHNLATLEASSKRNRRFTHRDINILKLIISSGLYPQIALADESNPYRKQNEQVFHNKDKQFLLLHPTSVFSLQPEFLESFYNTDETNSKQKAPEGRYLDCKEFLIYVSLLETNKPYIMNSMKVPALQTLLLLSRSITTNSDCSKVVVDDWIELTFEKEFVVRNLLGNVVRLRTAWDTLLEEKLVLCDDEDKNVVYQRLKKIRRLEEIVSIKLAEFLDAKIEYKLRRLSSLDIKCMYISDNEKRNVDINNQSSSEDCSLPSSSCPAGEKGGNAVTPYLTFGCIRDDFTLAVAANKAEYLVEHYHCQTCGEHVIGTLYEQLKHNESCGIVEGGEEGMETEGKEHEEENPVKEQHPSSSKSSYFCELCKTQLDLTPVEILKHKLTHR